jgi:type IV secretory pathway VirB2 component (pilin)
MNMKKIAAFGVGLLMTAPVFAAGGDGTITDALNGLKDMMTGDAAIAVATIAIAGTGWAWMTGHISMKTATVIGIGIGIIFGAGEIAGALGAK